MSAMSAGKILLVPPLQSEPGEVAGMLGGFEVLEAAGAPEAAECLRSDATIEVIAADYSLLREPPLGQAGMEHPEVMQVAFATEAEVTACLVALGKGPMAGFVQLPIREGQLLQAVTLALARRRLNRELEQLSRRLAEAEQTPGAAEEEMKGSQNEALTIAAHDLRSPLSVIVGYATVLGESEPGLSGQGREILERIGVTGTRLLSMVDRILELAAIESGQMAIEYAETHLSEMVRETVETLAGMIEEKRLVLTVEVSGDDTTFLLDRNRIFQALQNLLSNAIKFSPEGGPLKVVCRGAPHEIAFSVSDAGPGLDAGQRARVFDRFSRFSGSGKQGSGLGLAISKAVVELHGGRIWVESEPGKGSTFHFTVVPRRRR